MACRSSVITLLVLALPAHFVGAQTMPSTSPSNAAAAALAWPRALNEGGNEIVIYQPQVEKWEGDRLTARAAISLKSASQAKQTFGVIFLSARTSVDRESRLVTLDDVTIDRISLPAAKTREAETLAMVRNDVPDAVKVVPLDHLEAALTAAENASAAKPIAVANNPPEIIVATKPTLLVLIDGIPALRPIEGTPNTMRVVNTRALIILDQSSNKYYLHAMNGWFTSTSPNGPWTAPLSVPPTLEPIKAALAKSNAIDLLDPVRPDAVPKAPPEILTRTKPAELIVCNGDPEYTPIADTNLLYVRNTDSPLFLEVTSSRYIVLVSGRWFGSMSLHGPWTHIPPAAFPVDFAKIPADSPKANVLVSVPGTPQAKEAVIANSIPQTASVSIANTHLTVTYDGKPDFKDIEGTTGLQYAINSPLPVIHIVESSSYWSVQNGVWFTALSPTGPWVVATTVPGVIYTIPVGSPIHYVTYVRVYGTSGDVVYVGYTPGYMGTCVSTDGVVVYGTGYYYLAYVGTYWVGYPPTYGYGAGFAWGAATGFAFGFAAGAIMGDCWVRPYWGPCWGYSHVDINTSSVYRNWGGGVTYANRHYDHDAWSGESHASGFGRSFNPYSGRSSVGGYESHLDHYSGDFDAKAAGATYDRSTGVVRGGGVRAEGDLDHPGDTDVDRGRFRYNTRTNTGAAVTDDNVYAGHDGNVYRYNRDDGGWQHYDEGDWKTAERDQNFSQNRQNLEQQRASRQAGQQRERSFRSAPPQRSFSSGAGGGGGGRIGGARGGGGRRR